MDNQDKKRILILETAVKRFAHFGLAKTTMTEIAKDLSLSKALLYYYFPDKLSLYVSVVEHIIKEVSDKILKNLQKETNTTNAIMALLDERHSFIQKYYAIFEYTQTMGADLPPDLLEKFNNAKDFEVKIIQSLLNKGVENGEFEINDVALTAEIYACAISGLKFNVINNCQNFFPSKADFSSILSKEKIFTKIFIKGLKANT